MGCKGTITVTLPSCRTTYGDLGPSTYSGDYSFLLHPGGRIKVTVPGSPSVRKALQNFKGDIKRLNG